eukprot:2923440-Rhodomonas_salina.1
MCSPTTRAFDHPTLSQYRTLTTLRYVSTRGFDQPTLGQYRSARWVRSAPFCSSMKRSTDT